MRKLDHPSTSKTTDEHFAKAIAGNELLAGVVKAAQKAAQQATEDRETNRQGSEEALKKIA